MGEFQVHRPWKEREGVSGTQTMEGAGRSFRYTDHGRSWKEFQVHRPWKELEGVSGTQTMEGAGRSFRGLLSMWDRTICSVPISGPTCFLGNGDSPNQCGT